MAEPREPTTVEECVETEPLLRAVRERIDKRAREAAGGAALPWSGTSEPVLKQRYRAVLAGFDFLATKEHITSALVDFEEALRDLEICMSCKEATGALLPEKERTKWRHFSIQGCLFATVDERERDEPDRAVHGHAGFYYALSRESWKERKPIFRYHECPGGPVARMRELADRWRWKGGDEE